MEKEPIGLYIFRFVAGFFLAAFMLMLYWSSALVEQELRQMQGSLEQVKSELVQIRSQLEKSKEELLHFYMQNQETKNVLPMPKREQAESPQSQAAAQEQAQGQNLLLQDPFYTSTLPKLLGKGFSPQGIQHSATIGKPDNLHPFSNWSQVAAWNDLCSINVSRPKVGKYETFSPDAAWKMEERIDPATGVPEFWIFLRKNLFWEPIRSDLFPPGFLLASQFQKRNRVTAEDFKFYYDAIMNPYVELQGAVSMRTYYNGIEQMLIVDPYTLVVRWRSELINGKRRIKYNAKLFTAALKPLASFVYKYFSNGAKIIEDDRNPDTYRTNSVWAQNFSVHWAKNIIVSCGPWTFEGMTERQIGFKRNPTYFSPLEALTAGIEVDFKQSPDTIWQQFQNNQLDSLALQPDQLSEFEKFLQTNVYKQQEVKQQGISRLDYVARSYQYIGWNNAKPYFKTAAVRRALTMAIDRQQIIQQKLNGLGIQTTSTFYRFSPSYDTSIIPLPYDPVQAQRALEKEGWIDTDGDGIIDKVIDGVKTPFRFTLIYFVKNPTTKSICEYVSTALKEIGIDCRLNGVDIADLSAQFDDKSFDALCLAWMLGTPPEDPRQLWHSSGAKQKGSSNAVGFANAEIDAIIDQLDYEYVPAKRVQLYHRFSQILYREQPYTFLYTPKVAFVYRDYLQNVFIPKDRQDLIPGANVSEPLSGLFWLKKQS